VGVEGGADRDAGQDVVDRPGEQRQPALLLEGGEVQQVGWVERR